MPTTPEDNIAIRRTPISGTNTDLQDHDEFYQAKAFSGKFRNGKIYPCVIEKYHPVTGHVDISIGDEILEFCTMLSTYIDETSGAGDYFKPALQSKACCVFLWDKAYILPAFIPSNADPDRREKHVYSPEDRITNDRIIAASNRTNITLRSAGIVEIKAIESCRRIYSRAKNWIRDLCHNYFMEAGPGEHEWKTGPWFTTDVRWYLRRWLWGAHVFKLHIGAIGDLINMYIRGDTTIDSIGDVSIDSEGTITVNSIGDVIVNSTGNITINSTGEVNINQIGNVDLNIDGNFNINVTEAWNVTAETINFTAEEISYLATSEDRDPQISITADSNTRDTDVSIVSHTALGLNANWSATSIVDLEFPATASYFAGGINTSPPPPPPPIHKHSVGGGDSTF
jgi:hypothetical protein